MSSFEPTKARDGSCGFSQERYNIMAWNIFKNRLLESIHLIEAPYFQVDRHNDSAVYRERVYCYELYHQLRSRLDAEFPFILNGELDKKGHGEICSYFGNGPDGPIPDFVVHIPGDVDNLVVMEVKTCHNSLKQAIKDINKMKIFIEAVGYRHGIFLLFGCKDSGSLEQLEPLRETDIGNRISLLWHRDLGEAAQIINGQAAWDLTE